MKASEKIVVKAMIIASLIIGGMIWIGVRSFAGLAIIWFFLFAGSAAGMQDQAIRDKLLDRLDRDEH